MAELGALVVYGYGAELGDFKAFADDLKTTDLAKRFKIVEIVNATLRSDFFKVLESFGAKQMIGELHIYTHAWGGGLAFGYKTRVTQENRSRVYQQTIARKRKIQYIEILDTEIGILFTDDLIRSPYNSKQAALRVMLAKDAFIKIWGCNSGVANWRYSDSNVDGSALYDEAVQLDPNNEAIGYYWRALNRQNTPKPAVAQAIANFFNCPVYGATSGSSVQVQYKGTWISSDGYRKATKRWPTEAQILRLHPDKGNYKKFDPTGK